ncbi:MAG: efflux RND transporter periplasmic adaptor subunit [Desulfobacterales bacterium]|nr:efflux RND transporter periplasmic adaptor subunit [Desulfobacterales bacterium]
MKKILISIFVILIAGLTVWYFFIEIPAEKNKETLSKTSKNIKVERGSIVVLVEATGRVVPNQEVEIKCKASGEVTKIPVDISDSVKKDEILLQIDPEDEKLLVRKCQASLSIYQARLEQSKLNLEIANLEITSERIKANSALKLAEVKNKEVKAKLLRIEQLFQKKMASEEELDAAKTIYIQASSDMESAITRMDDIKILEIQTNYKRQDIKIAEAQVEVDNISLSDARQRLADTTVVSPINGIIVQRNVQAGQIIASGINNVGGGTTVMTLADLSSIYILVSVDESDIGQIVIGQNVKITVDAYSNETFWGAVNRVAAKGAVTSNVVTFEVKVEVTSKNKHLLKPEMTANVEIITIEKKDVLIVPVAALGRKKNERFVTIPKQDDKNEEKSVITGDTDGIFIEIVSVISEGDIIVAPSDSSESPWRKDNSSRQNQAGMRMMGRNLKK